MGRKEGRCLPLTRLEYSIEQHYGWHPHLIDLGTQIFEKFAKPSSRFMQKPIAENNVLGGKHRDKGNNKSSDAHFTYT